MTNWDRLSVRISSASVGRCEISMVFLLLLLGTRYLMPLRSPAVTRCARLRRACDHRRPALGSVQGVLLRVVLDDQLLGERHVDLGTLGQLVDQDALTLADHLQPAWDRTITGSLPCDL